MLDLRICMIVVSRALDIAPTNCQLPAHEIGECRHEVQGRPCNRRENSRGVVDLGMRTNLQLKTRPDFGPILVMPYLNLIFRAHENGSGTICPIWGNSAHSGAHTYITKTLWKNLLQSTISIFFRNLPPLNNLNQSN